MLENNIRFAWVFMWKFLSINVFTPFLDHFTPFFSYLQISNLDHNNHLYKCYKTIYSLHGFSFEISSISTISHLFWAFSHLFFHTSKFSNWTIKPPNKVLQAYVKFAWIFIWKFIYINVFTPFFDHFTPLFHTSIFSIWTITTT